MKMKKPKFTLTGVEAEEITFTPVTFAILMVTFLIAAVLYDLLTG